MLLVDLVVDVPAQFWHDLVDAEVLVRGFVARSRDDEWRSRFVDEDRVDFVDDRVVKLTLDSVGDIELHVVAQIVEPEFVVGSIRDIGTVRSLALFIVESMVDDADTQTEEFVQPAHPFRVAPGEIIVHGDDMHALAFERIQVSRRRRNQRFSFTGFHFRYPALVQRDSADELHIEVPHVQNALARFHERPRRLREECPRAFRRWRTAV